MPHTFKMENPRICFTRGDTIHVIALKDVATMTYDDLKTYKPWVVGHVCETYDPKECEAGNAILDAMDVRLKELSPPKK